MSDDQPRRLARRVAELARELAHEPRLAAEVLRARREFFGHHLAGDDGARAAGAAADMAEHRFAEWFLLERDSEVLGAVPQTVPPYADRAGELDGSLAGVFLVQGAVAGTVTARDVQSRSLVELDVPPGALEAGDLVVGRLYAAAGERFTPSVAAAVFRPGTELASAFGRDVARLDLGRRLHQVELEHLLLRRPSSIPTRPFALPEHADDAAEPPAPLEHLEADLEQLLRTANAKHNAAAISQELADAVRPGVVLGPLLDELAFHTSVDLDRARQLLLHIWNAHHSVRGEAPEQVEEPSSGPPGETLGERLARTLDEGLRQKRDVNELFAQLEQMAGIDDDDDEDDGDPEDFGGDLEPLVEEYLWETSRSDDPAAEPLRLLVELQRNAPLPRTDVERITGGDLTRLLLHVYLGADPRQRAVAVRAAFDELRGFYEWAVRVQELDVGDALAECRGSLLDQVDRLQAAGVALSDGSTAVIGRPGLLQIEDLGEQGFGVRDDDGGHHWLSAGTAALAHLRVGDLVLGALADGQDRNRRSLGGLVVVLPADARSLIE